MSGQPSYTETIKLELQLADIQSQLTQRTAELQAAKREVDVWKEKAELRGKEACAQRAELERVRAALERIARYGNDGICPFGCDTPYIAQQALGQHRQGME